MRRALCFLILIVFWAFAFGQAAERIEDGETNIAGQKSAGPLSSMFAEKEINFEPSSCLLSPFFKSGGQPLVDDPVLLLVNKSWDGVNGRWIIDLNWGGGDSPYTVSYSGDASFQQGVKTLEANFPQTSLSVIENSAYSLECFSVTEEGGVSPAAQGLGSDPYPEIPTPVIEESGLWWGDEVTLSGNYFDLIPSENYLGIFSRYVKANSVVDGGNGYGASVKFTVPEDGRGCYAYVSTNGKYPFAAPYLELNPRNIPSFSNIRNVIYSPQTGHIWVSSDNRIDEIDIFKREPQIVRTITQYVKPYISQVTSGGKILVVDGVSGVSEIDQIDVSSGSVTLYASTTDTSHTPNFTRQILPYGIAADPDGSAAYIADGISGAGSSKVVRFPSGNGSAITDTYGKASDWNFPDPCGMDVGLSHKLFVGMATNAIRYITAPGSNPSGASTYTYMTTSATPYLIHLDRDVSTASYDRFFYNDIPECFAFNKNEIEGNDPVYLGSCIYGKSNGKLSVEPMWDYLIGGSAPKPVILNNSGINYPYPAPSYQVADRVVKLSVKGWYNVPIHLRLIDPPDISPYAPYNGWEPKGGKTAVFPYEANDNDVWNDPSNTDWGLSASMPGTLNRNLEIDVYPSSNNYATFYLKLPARYAGDNWQVEVRKRSASTGALVPNQVCYNSSMFTGWKRVYVERDKMFRRGNLFDPDVSSPPPSQLYLLRWDETTPINEPKYVQGGEQIVIFDSCYSYPGGNYEVATVLADPPPDFFEAPLPAGGTKCVLLVHLDHNLTNTYTPSPIDFSSGNSAAVGVISGCDFESNQINSSNSCFYDADMRAIQKTFNDAFVEFIGLRDGMGAVPYVDPKVQFYGSAVDDMNARMYFREIWCNNKTPNYLYLLGCCGKDFDPEGTAVGTTEANVKLSYIYRETLEQKGDYDGYTEEQVNLATQKCTNHEFGHQFHTNFCSNLTCGPYVNAGKHDARAWWNYSTTDCPNSNPCLMDPRGGNLIDGINRFCKEDLLLGDPGCSNPSVKLDTAVRTISDPLP